MYLVFWFGEVKGRRLPKPPAGTAQPKTAAEMEAALRQLYSGEEWRDTEFICIDCSARETTNSRKKQTKKRATKRRNRAGGVK